MGESEAEDHPRSAPLAAGVSSSPLLPLPLLAGGVEAKREAARRAEAEECSDGPLWRRSRMLNVRRLPAVRHDDAEEEEEEEEEVVAVGERERERWLCSSLSDLRSWRRLGGASSEEEDSSAGCWASAVRGANMLRVGGW